MNRSYDEADEVLTPDMSSREALDAYLSYYGILGSTDRILRAIDRFYGTNLDNESQTVKPALGIQSELSQKPRSNDERS